MIWLVWRQHRQQALFTLVGLAALAGLMIPTGLTMRHAYDQAGLPDCVRALGTADRAAPATDACDNAFHQFSNRFDAFAVIGVLFLILPLLVGLFWGAPLVAREVEQGTHRLVWTQGVSRRRWALVKFSLVGATTLVVSVIYGLGISWWIAPLTNIGDQTRLSAPLFDMQGVVPIGYTLFAVALGIAAGTIWPKVLPAMGVTLGGFVAVRVALAALARPHYLPPRTLSYPVRGSLGGSPNPALGNWVLSFGVRDANGVMVAPNSEIACPPDATGPGADCGHGLGLTNGAYNWQQYQPGSRFWLFQGIETGIFVVLAAVLVYVAIRRIRRIA